jgi:predicted nucleotidyltransferase
MEKSEKALKVMLEFIFLSIALFFAKLILNMPTVHALVLSIFIAHSLNWLLDGHFFVLMKNIGLHKRSTSRSFHRFLIAMRHRWQGNPSVLALVVFGSTSRGEITPSSDLDVRVVRQKGFRSAVIVALKVWLERLQALFRGFPLDIYVVSSLDKLKNRLDPREQPIVILDPTNAVRETYDSVMTLDSIL